MGQGMSADQITLIVEGSLWLGLMVVEIVVDLVNRFRRPPKRPKNLPDTFDGENAEEKRASVRASIGMDCVNKYNFGVTGLSGVGKSTLINSVRGLGPLHEGAAAVGVQETTKCQKAYPDPVHSHLVYWDTPGCGTPTVPLRDYFKNQKLICFDCLIIVVGTRIMEADIEIARTATENHIPMYFVRSQSDKSIADIMVNQNVGVKEAVGILRKVCKEQRKELDDCGFPQIGYFVISSRAMFKFFASQTLTNEYQFMDESQSVLSAADASRR
jgi:GTP-binding protein EngB required for normal cell division